MWLAGFATNDLSPLLLQLLETVARPVTKAIKHLKPLLGFEKAGLLLIKLGLVKLPTAMQDLFVRLGGVDEDGPFAIADDKLVDGLAALNLTLSGAQPAKEGFQVIIRAVALRPRVALEESCPALAEGRADPCDHPRVSRTALRVLLQLGQKLFDLTLNLLAGRAQLTLDLWRVETPLQFHQPVPLAFELLIAGGKSLVAVGHGQQLIQERVPPF